MKLIIHLVFFVFTSSTMVVFGQTRHAENDVTMHHDTMYLKKSMEKITGLVFSEHGEVGEFIGGLKEGLHKEWYRSGHLKDEINFHKGIKEGEYRYWSDHGQLTEEGHYLNGKLDGLIKEWYKNGNIKLEVNYKNGEMHGKGTYYSTDGKKKRFVEWKNGKLVE